MCSALLSAGCPLRYCILASRAKFGELRGFRIAVRGALALVIRNDDGDSSYTSVGLDEELRDRTRKPYEAPKCDDDCRRIHCVRFLVTNNSGRGPVEVLPIMSFSMTEDFITRTPVRFLRLPAVKQITGLGKTALYERIKLGQFPPPVKLGGRAVGWVEEEVDQWARQRVAAARVMPRRLAQVDLAA
jgi:prophage regulatory protein